MAVSMLATAGAEVSRAEQEARAEPAWNSAGVRLHELLEEYADNPEILAMLEDFKAQNLSELVGEIPVVDVQEFICEELRQEVMDSFEFVPFTGGNWEDKLSLVATSSGIAPMNALPGVACNCCGEFKYVVNSDLNNTGVTINGRMRAAYRRVVIPTTIRAGNVTRTVTQIGDVAFSQTDIYFVVIPKSVTTIGIGAFANCPSLTELYFLRETPPIFVWEPFMATHNVKEIWVPVGALQTYKDSLEKVLDDSQARYIGRCRNGSNPERCKCCQFRVGDVNKNGTIDRDDADQISRYIIGLPNPIKGSNGKYNHDARNAAQVTNISRTQNRITVDDSLAILAFLANPNNNPFNLG